MNDNKHTTPEELSSKLNHAIESLFKSAALTHVDELTTVVRLDNIGKRYGIFMEGNGVKEITFQTGNPAENINGITIESLLAICIDRLEIFNGGPTIELPYEISTGDLIPTPVDFSENIPISNQAIVATGGFPCIENAIAIENCKSAIEALKARQKRRKKEDEAGTL